MANKIAIVSVAQIGHNDASDKNLREISYEVVKSTLNQVGMKVEAKWRDERQGNINDIEYFKPI